ncbi:hypothetical protein [Flavobacterium sp.]|uniref:hypothetical protein n=1 Tax=Flavobacterium sp. TaxID=239 RepID=UPI00391DE904
MKQNDLESYKKAVKQHYEKEKKGYYSSFLLQPSRANLRKLCVERLKENVTSDDLNTFKIFMGFEFKPENRNKLKDETDRFRTIENFIKGITDSNDVEVINLAAILVDFSPRPFLKFVRFINGQKDAVIEEKTVADVKDENEEIKISTKKKSERKKKLIFWLLGFTALFSIGYTANDLVLPEKQCMQWQNDHYELLECDSEINGLYSEAVIEPKDHKVLDLRKIEVYDTTTFFKGGKAVVWYCKVKEELEFFNNPGFHPITKKSLKPVTDYILGKYVREK